MANVSEAAEFNPESPLVMLAAAKIHTAQGNWEAALKAAEYVLDSEPKNYKDSDTSIPFLTIFTRAKSYSKGYLIS